MSDAEEETVSKIQQITASTETVEVGDVEFEIHPLTNNEFLDFVASNRNQERDEGEVMVDIVTAILQKDDPSITKEGVREAPAELTIKVVDAMEQVNGLEDFFEKAANEMQSQQR